MPTMFLPFVWCKLLLLAVCIELAMNKCAKVLSSASLLFYKNLHGSYPYAGDHLRLLRSSNMC